MLRSWRGCDRAALSLDVTRRCALDMGQSIRRRYSNNVCPNTGSYVRRPRAVPSESVLRVASDKSYRWSPDPTAISGGVYFAATGPRQYWD
jgi:hypothetical protein